MRTRYAVVVSASETSYGVHAPDIDGCIAVAKTREDALARFRAALQAHLAWMARDGDPIPEPTTAVDYVEVEVPEVGTRSGAAAS